MIETSSPRHQPDALCRARYKFLAREVRQHGFNHHEIIRSANDFVEQRGERHYITREAYLPTGIALGCPLPDAQVTRHLLRLSQLIDGCVTQLSGGQRPAFAYVPSEAYHITLVNRTHFDTSAAVTPMTAEDVNRAREVIQEASVGPSALLLGGMILTVSGRLIVPGFSADDRIYRLRAFIAEAMPQLRINLPRTLHIKLGHVLVPLVGNDLKALLDYVALCGECVSARLTFGDVFLPSCRIPL